jgi:flagellar M-ring protein FliF
MNEFIRQLQADIARIWTGLSRTQQIVFGAVAVASLVALVSLVMWAQTPEWTPLYTKLDAADANAIVEKLKDAKVPYQVQGDAILVPKNRANELRISMSSLVQNGIIGFEIFDKNQFGMTDALQKLNYMRALQGELTRTIESLEGVDSARVHLVLPEKDLFSDSQKDPTAAIVLKMKMGGRLKPDQIKAIVHLVSKSVEGLKEGNVAITDVDGRNYTDELGLGKDQDPTNPEMSMSQLEVKKNVENTLKKKLQNTLDIALGPGNAVVNVSADMDFSQVETNDETYAPVLKSPDGSGSGIPVSTKEMQETYIGQGAQAGGVPGVTSNQSAGGGVPNYQASESVGGTGHYEKRDLLNNFAVNKAVSRKIKAPGELKRLSVSVLLNGEFDPQQIADYKRNLSAAAGIEVARGDTLDVTATKFNDAAKVQEAAEIAKEKQTEQTQGYIKIIAGILIGIVALVLLRRGLAGRQEAFADGPLSLEGFDVDGRMTPPPSIGTVGEDDRKTHLQKEITKVVKQQPAEVAKLLKSWMLEDE